MGFERPLLDATPPDVEALARALPEHLHWASVPPEARASLHSHSADADGSSDVQHAVARSAVDGMQVHRHVVEASISYSRCEPTLCGPYVACTQHKRCLSKYSAFRSRAAARVERQSVRLLACRQVAMCNEDVTLPSRPTPCLRGLLHSGVSGSSSMCCTFAPSRCEGSHQCTVLQSPRTSTHRRRVHGHHWRRSQANATDGPRHAEAEAAKCRGRASRRGQVATTTVRNLRLAVAAARRCGLCFAHMTATWTSGRVQAS